MDDPAVTNLLMAHQYLERFRALVGTTKWDEADQLVRFIGKHLLEAHKQNPHAMISVQEGRETVTYTFDEIAERALHIEGRMNNTPAQDWQTLLRSEMALQKAATYDASEPRNQIGLAEIYLRQYKRQDALDVLHEAIKLDPTNFDALDLLNRIQENPKIGVNPHLARREMIIVLIETLAPLIGVPAAIYSFVTGAYGNNRQGDGAGTIAFFCVIAWVIAKAMKHKLNKEVEYINEHGHHKDELK